MSVSDLSASTQDYLKAIWELEEWSDEPATTSMIAKALGVKQSTVSDTVRKLADQKLVSHKRYGSVQLTEQGRAHALQMVRRHRLIETFLVQVLDYSWDEVHDEAEQLEHAVSDLLVERVSALLHHPTRDPHGDPIPAADGSINAPKAVTLSTVEPGSDVVIERISDEDPELLRFLHAHGLNVGSHLHVAEGAPFSGAVEVQNAADGVTIPLGRAATDAVYVSAPGHAPAPGAQKDTRA